MNRTSIEWTDWSCNPLKMQLPDGSLVNACQRISPGCHNCYAEAFVKRFWQKAWGKLPGYTAALLRLGKPVLLEKELDAVLKLEERIAAGKGDPNVNKVFWNDVTDEFLSFWPDEFLDRLSAVRALTPHLIHQVLTKRPRRMREYLTTRGYQAFNAFRLETEQWPPDNIWWGISIEDQPRADERVPDLISTPAAVRFLSCEPLLSDLNLRGFFGLEAWQWQGETQMCQTGLIHWAISGHESGAGRRPGRAAHVLSLMEQCDLGGVAFFNKQMQIGGLVSHDPAEWPAAFRVRCYPRLPVTQVGQWTS